ncbi:MAG: hypothetical protein ABI389_13965 [Rhodanobacter sp.]
MSGSADGPRRAAPVLCFEIEGLLRSQARTRQARRAVARLGVRETHDRIVIRPGFTEPQQIFRIHVAIMLTIAVVLFYVPARRFSPVRLLHAKGTNSFRVEQGNRAWQCLLGDTWIDPDQWAWGNAHPDTGQIVSRSPCDDVWKRGSGKIERTSFNVPRTNDALTRLWLKPVAVRTGFNFLHPGSAPEIHFPACFHS